jgi:hypothetical protein
MKRQAELGAAMQAAWQEKQRIEDMRKQQRQEEAKKVCVSEGCQQWKQGQLLCHQSPGGACCRGVSCRPA